MSDTPGSAPISERTALVGLAAVGVLLAALVLAPYLEYVLLAVVLAYVLFPLQQRLEEYATPTVGAVSLTLAVVLLVVLPVAYVVLIAIRQGLRLASIARQGTFDPDAIEVRLGELGYEVDLQELYAANAGVIDDALGRVAGAGLNLVLGLPNLFVGLTIAMFVVFALLRDGDRLVRWFRAVVPIHDDVQTELFDELDRLMWASVVGNVVVAAIQALALGVGLALLGVPAAVFLTVATFVLALLPLVGAFGVWVPASIYLVAVGRPVAAVVLFAYGSLVSVSDLYLRPVVIGHSGALDAATIVVGIFGGVAVFGGVGLFVGPVLLGSAKAILDVFARGGTTS